MNQKPLLRKIIVAAIFACVIPGSAIFGQTPEEPSAFQRSAALFQSKCAKCHTIGRGNRVGPDLKGVGGRRDREWLEGFIAKPSAYLDSDPEAMKLLERFKGVRMEDIRLGKADIDGLLEYIETAGAGPLPGDDIPEPLTEEASFEKIAMPDEQGGLLLPGLAATLLLLGAAAGLWNLGLGRFGLIAVILAAGTGYWSLGGRKYHRLLGNQQGYSPAQPIAFSHKRHAGDLRIACVNCHHGARKSDVAGVPSVNLCMNCHKAVRSAVKDAVKGAGKAAQPEKTSPEIAKISLVWARRQDPGAPSIEWTRVHSLPDFVHFSHRVHTANNIHCQECHGPVETMERMRQATPLSMGWCVNCHRKSPGTARTHWKRTKGPLDCAACHW